MSSSNKAVIWDLNGVIIDDMRFHLLAFQALLREFGHDMTEEYLVEKCVGTTPTEVFEDILPGIGNPVSIKEATERKIAHYFRIIEGKMSMLPGARALIEDLDRNGVKQAIASGATRMEVEAILKEFGIRDFFGAVVVCEDVRRGKPNPEPFLTAASRIDIKPEDCLVIEDGEYGVRAATTCGMRTIAVTNTQTRDDLAAADLIVDSLEEIDARRVLELLRQPELNAGHSASCV